MRKAPNICHLGRAGSVLWVLLPLLTINTLLLNIFVLSSWPNDDVRLMSLKSLTSGRAKQCRKSPPITPEEEVLLKSVDRSRKRFLSPGLLRGEQAADRLIQQEEGASPFLKRARSTPESPPPPHGMALSAEEFRKAISGIDSKFDKRFDSLDSTISTLHNSVRENSAQIEKHSTLIKEGQRDVEMLRQEVADLKNPTVRNPLLPSPRTRTSAWNDENSSEYLRARRSLRIWPVVGTTGEQLWKETGDFLHVLLNLPSIGEDQIEGIARPPSASSFAAKHEVVITFKSHETRDTVIGQSARLSTRIDDQGRPTAGIRIEVPSSLRRTFALLFKFGTQLRQRHGPGTRRHIKFDDGERTLFLNVKLPGDNEWSRVSEELAQRGLQIRDRAASLELEARFDLGGRGQGSRTSSTSTASSRPAAAWTGRRTESAST